MAAKIRAGAGRPLITTSPSIGGSFCSCPPPARQSRCAARQCKSFGNVSSRRRPRDYGGRMRLILLVGIAAVGLVPAAFAASPTGKTMQATLTGRAEVPRGPTTASGGVTVRVTGPRRVCWTFKLGRVAAPTAAHIHRGDPGQRGPIVIPLGKAYRATGCAAAPAAAVIALVKHPRRFYVNVHNASYPGGVVRGQLHKLG
jgi:hypothetical protein